MANSQHLQLVIDAENKTDAALKSVNSNLDSVNSKLMELEPAFKGMALVGGATFAGISLGIKGAVDAASDLQQAQISFETMLGSAQKAQSFITQMKDFAKRTPFETSDISKAAQTMLAFGINVKDVMPSVQMIGDVAMGNKEKFSMLSLAFAQVQSTGRLMGQDLLQMVNQGFNPLQIISEKTGKSMADLKKEMEKGQISAQMVAEAFKIATSEGGRFNGGMEKQSKSLDGLVSTMNDATKEVKTSIGNVLIPILSDLVVKITPVIEKIGAWVQEHPKLTMAIIGITGILAGLVAIIGVIGLILPGIIAGFTALAAIGGILATAIMGVTLPFVLISAAIAGLIALGVYLYKNWDEVKAKAESVWTEIANFFNVIWSNITITIQNSWNGIVVFFTSVWQTILNIFSFSASFAVGLVIGAFNLMGIDIIGVFQSIQDFILAFWNNLTIIINVAMEALKLAWSLAWEGIKLVVITVWDSIKGVVGGSFVWLTSTFKNLTKPISDAWGTLWSAVGDKVVSVWDGIKNVIKDSVNWMIGKINAVIAGMNAVAAAGAGAIGIKPVSIPSIPMLASGGIVNQPTLAMIGEAGPEAVVPLNKAAGFGGLTINFYGDVYGDEDFLNKIGGRIMDAIKANVRLA